MRRKWNRKNERERGRKVTQNKQTKKGVIISKGRMFDQE